MQVILIVLVLLFVLACAPYPETSTPKPEISDDGEGYKLHCDYYPAYNLSLLYIRASASDHSGLTGNFFDGNICK